MSLDYPDRAAWLVVRATPRKRPWRLFHMSAPLMAMKDADGTTRLVVQHPGKTYRRQSA